MRLAQLIDALGWQGGTIGQVGLALGINGWLLLDMGELEFNTWLIKARQLRGKR